MRDIIYDVAVSLDGYIATYDSHGNADASAFPQTGPHVVDYGKRLQSYGSVIMGRKTYEFGYAFGLPPGARAYPHMEHFIFSETLQVPDKSDVHIVRNDWLAKIDALRSESGAPIYLCGGGQFAGYLLHHGRITLLRLKLAPLVLGSGIRIFSGVREPVLTNQVSHKHYDNGVVYLEYALH